MKSTHFSAIERLATRRFSAKRISMGLAIAIAMGVPNQGVVAATLAVDLGSAADFAALAGAGITFTAPINSTVVNGDIGSFTVTTISGLENAIINGVNHAGDGVTQLAKIELGGAFTDAQGRPTDVFFPLIHDVGGDTLASGVYNAPSSLAITGVVTLDGGGNADAVWIFQIASTLITASGSSVNLINGAQASNIFWQVGTSATLGVGSDFMGTIMAQDSITLNPNATMTGRALALAGAVTFNSNNIIMVPETGSSMLFALGLSLAALSRRRTLQES